MITSEQLWHGIEDILHSGKPAAEALQELCALLKHEVDYYDWVGFYLLPQNSSSLILGPYSGAPTNHVTIPIGRGICGQAIEKNETIVVQDVSQEGNYLSCSLHVQSEIVVPVHNGENVIGEIDIDSHLHSPFSQDDRIWLEKLAARIAPLLQAILPEAAAIPEN